MRGALILSLIIAVAAVVFAIQNPGTVELVLGPYPVTTSKALVIILTFGAGVLVGMLAGLPGRIRHRRRLRTLEHQTREPETDVYGTGTDIGTGTGTASGYTEPREHGRIKP